MFFRVVSAILDLSFSNVVYLFIYLQYSLELACQSPPKNLLGYFNGIVTKLQIDLVCYTFKILFAQKIISYYFIIIVGISLIAKSIKFMWFGLFHLKALRNYSDLIFLHWSSVETRGAPHYFTPRSFSFSLLCFSSHVYIYSALDPCLSLFQIFKICISQKTY